MEGEVSDLRINLKYRTTAKHNCSINATAGMAVDYTQGWKYGALSSTRYFAGLFFFEGGAPPFLGFLPAFPPPRVAP